MPGTRAPKDSDKDPKMRPEVEKAFEESYKRNEEALKRLAKL